MGFTLIEETLHQNDLVLYGNVLKGHGGYIDNNSAFSVESFSDNTDKGKILHFKKRLLFRWTQNNTPSEAQSTREEEEAAAQQNLAVICKDTDPFLSINQQEKEIHLTRQFDDRTKLIFKEFMTNEASHIQNSISISHLYGSMGLNRYKMFSDDYSDIIYLTSICTNVVRNVFMFTNDRCFLHSIIFYSNDYMFFLNHFSVLVAHIELIFTDSTSYRLEEIQRNTDDFYNLSLEKNQNIFFYYSSTRNNRFIDKNYELEGASSDMTYWQLTHFVLYEISKLNEKIDNIDSLIIILFINYPNSPAYNYCDLMKRQKYRNFIHKTFLLLKTFNDDFPKLTNMKHVNYLVSKLLHEYVEIDGKQLSVFNRRHAKRRLVENNARGIKSTLFSLDNYFIIKLLIESSEKYRQVFFKGLFNSDWDDVKFKEPFLPLRLIIYNFKMLNHIAGALKSIYTT